MDSAAQEQNTATFTPNEGATLSPRKSRSTKKLLIFIVLILTVAVAGLVVNHLIKNFNRQSKISTTPTTSNLESFSPTPSPINLPLASLNSLSGKIVYTLGIAILVSNPDGSNPMKLIDSKNKLGFAGWSDNGRIYYWTELSGSTFTLYKKDLAINSVIPLFSFEGNNKNIEFYNGNAQVSNDGKHVIYSRSGDIHLVNLVDKSDKKLLTKKDCLSTNSVRRPPPHLIKSANAAGPGDCFGYYYPEWSSDSKRVVIRKIFYEGARQVAINPFQGEIKEVEFEQGGTPKWSPSNRKMVIAGSGYGLGSLYFIPNVDTTLLQDIFLTNNEFKNSSADSVVWSIDDRVAFTYSNYDKQEFGIGIYDFKSNTFKKLISIPNEYYYLQVWLPGKNTLLYSDEKNHVWALDINTLTKNELPIQAEAGIMLVP